MFDKDGAVILLDGKSHLNICMTSKRLLANLDKRGVHHLDCSYKITIHGYPLLIYGIPDTVAKYI
jgi:hypothetical protein